MVLRDVAPEITPAVWFCGRHGYDPCAVRGERYAVPGMWNQPPSGNDWSAPRRATAGFAAGVESSSMSAAWIRTKHKKPRRLYAEERLQVRRRGGRKRALGTRAPMTRPQGPNQRWSLDFVVGHADRWAAVPPPCGSGRLDPRVPDPGRRRIHYLGLGPACASDAPPTPYASHGDSARNPGGSLNGRTAYPGSDARVRKLTKPFRR